LRIRPENAWEIREQLLTAQKAGKQVLLFIDRPGVTGYHLASVADCIVMDPMGQLILPGYALSRTYVKGTLDKLGLGFDEWRFFKYKSANESFSRENMSDPDRDQLQDYLDDWYENTREAVCSARNIGTAEFDRIIDEEGFILAGRALELSLVDTLARWSDVGDIITARHGKKKPIANSRLLANQLRKQNWGAGARIAVVYALGLCDMDSGIRARWLGNLLRQLAASKTVRAVVVRVDSPGGDGMASDVVAQALRKCAAVKPVIVSQGQTAASGGYWISMYGDTVLAAPTTLTGSIGVISGWIWDEGFGDKLGMTSDLVQRGKHADLWRGITLPLLNITVPARPVTEEERARAETIILELYDDFVRKTAEARGLKEADVREIAQGRMYSGKAGRELGLVDGIGGLAMAIDIAKQRARLQRGEEVELVEYPNRKGLLNLRGQLSPVALSLDGEQSVELLRLFTEKGGQALPYVLPGIYPDFDR
jgi:protease-4